MARLRTAGCTVSATGGGHWKVTRPGRPGQVILSESPSDHRSRQNDLSLIRRVLGVDLKAR